MSTLFLDVGPDDIVQIGDNLAVMIERKSGKRVRLKIVGKAPVDLQKKARLVAEPEDKKTALNA